MHTFRGLFSRLLRFLGGQSIQDGRGQFKRIAAIVFLACLLVLALSPLAILATRWRLHDSVNQLPTPYPTGTQFGTGPKPTVVPPTQANAPVKGLTDNPAYQWWRWPHHPQPDSWWGDTQDTQSLETQISAMQELGVKLFRVELVWPFVAPSMPGGSSYDSATARDPNWSGYQWDRWDLIVKLTAAAGIQLLPQVLYTPDWASGVTATTNGGPNNHPLAARYYGDFMFALVTRYTGRIHYWEMWNEPDYPNSSWIDAASGSLQTYVDLVLKPGYQSVKQADPTATVLLGGLAGGFNMAKVYAAGGGPYFDIGNVHEYSSGAGGDAAAVDQARGAMNANGDHNKPLWLTEFGQKTQADGTSAESTGNVQVDEQTQAQLIKGVFAIPSVQAIFYYQLHDTSVYNASRTIVKRVYWGLVNHDFTHHKLGYTAYRDVVGGPLTLLGLSSSHLTNSQSPVAPQSTAPSLFARREPTFE